MKKVVIGCLTLFLILVIAAVGVFSYGAYKIYQFQQSVTVAMTELEEVNQRYPFTRPDGDLMDPDRFDVYLETRIEIVKSIQKNDAVMRMIGSGDTMGATPELSVKEAVSLIASISDVVLEVSAVLDEQEMSADEYMFYLQSTLSSIHYAQMNGNEEFIELWKKIEMQSRDADEKLTKEGSVKVDMTRRLIWSSNPKGDKENLDLILAHQDEFLNHPKTTIIELFVAGLVEGYRSGYKTGQAIGKNAKANNQMAPAGS